MRSTSPSPAMIVDQDEGRPTHDQLASYVVHDDDEDDRPNI